MRLACTIANAAWLTASLNRYQQFRNALRNPDAVQRAVLIRIVQRNADTQFGRTFDFSSITSVTEYQKRVPLSLYDDYEAHVSRLMKDERGVLTAAPVRRLVPTSGSSSARKLIPYTDELLGEFNRAIGPWIVDMLLRNPSIMHGPAYWSISPVGIKSDHDESTVPVGFDDDTEYLGRWASRVAATTLAVPSIVRLIDDMAAWRYTTLAFLLRARDLRLISVWHPTFLTLLLESLSEHWESIVADIAQGRISPPNPLPGNVASRIDTLIRADRKRARELSALQPRDFGRIWPKLKLVSAWGDGHALNYAAQLHQTFPHAIIQRKGLVATEGIVTIPFGSCHPVAVRSHFYEFIDDDGVARLVGDLEVGGEYTVVLTTGGGLYRYQLCDRVRVTGRCEQTPSLEFIGKEDDVSDRFGEKLNGRFVSRALTRIFADHNVSPTFAMLAPECEAGRWRYVLHVEVKSPPSLLLQLANDLDRALRENPHYEYCVRLGQLMPATVAPAPSNAMSLYVEKICKQGGRAGEIKPSPLDSRSGWSAVFSSNRR